MERISGFLVGKRNILCAVFIALAVVGVILSGNVVKNTDMKKYLPDGSDTKVGFELMQKVFPEDDLTGALNVMVYGLTDGEKTAFKTDFEAIDGVSSVEYDGTESCNKDGYSLYKLTVGDSAGSATATDVYKEVQRLCSDRETYFGGEVYMKNIPILPPWVMLLAIGIVSAVLLVMCDSFIAPVLFIAGILIAIAINMGSNIIFGEISAITDSVAAILQLALSMDYSIMLMERYRQEREKTDDKDEALKNAVSASLLSIAGSAQTTVVGLLTLVFMSFTVGKDLGLVLAKGVLISMLCVFGVLPALIGLFDKLIKKTRKKAPVFRTDGYTSFLYRAKIPLTCVFLAVFVAACFLQRDPKMTYTGAELDHISSVFGNENDMVLIYKNEYESGLQPILEEIEKDGGVTSVLSSSNTVNKPLTYNEVKNKCASAGIALDVDERVIKLVYYRYANPSETHEMTAGEFAEFLLKTAEETGLLSEYADGADEQLALLARLSTKDAVNGELTSREMSELLGTEPETMNLLYAFVRRDTMSPLELVEYIKSGGTLVRAAVGEEKLALIGILERYMKAVDGGGHYTYAAMAEIFDGTPVTEAVAEAAYALYGSGEEDVTAALSLKQLLLYITEDFSDDDAFSGFIGGDMRQKLSEGTELLTAAETMLKKEDYGRALIRTVYPAEGEETFAFVERTRALLGDYDDKEVYLVGDSTYATEMHADFGGEYALIAVLTMTAIFVIVLLTFRSLVIPVILVAVIQCAVYTTMSIMNLSGATLYFLAILVMQSLLMGATIDYAILFTSYYRESRRMLDRKPALMAAYGKSVGTILTSAIILTAGTLIVGWFAIEIVAKICLSIAYGTVSATVLILVFAPAMISLADRFVIKKKKTKDEKHV